MLIKVVKRKMFTLSRPPVMLLSVMRVLMFMGRAAGARPRSHYNAGRAVAGCRSRLNHQPGGDWGLCGRRGARYGSADFRQSGRLRGGRHRRLVVQPRPATATERPAL